MKKVVAGMDLHSNNVVIGIMDLDGKRVASRKVPCELKEVVKFLAPFKLIGIWFLVFGARQVLDAARVNHSN